MTEDEALEGVKSVLAKISKAKKADIKRKDKLKLYAPPMMAMVLALQVDRRFPKVDLTDLTNALYDDVATVGDLVDYVVEAYEDED